MKKVYLLFVFLYLVVQNVSSQIGNTVAGGNGKGSAANQLSGAQDFCIDGVGNIYIADADNNRIQKWAVGATEGITVAGGNGQGSAANQLNHPDAVAIDAAGNIYVHDGSNFRIQKFARGAFEAVTLIGSTFGKGIFVDASGNVYFFDAINYAINKFNPVTSQVTVVAGGHGRGPANNQIGYAEHVFVDSNSNVYVYDPPNKRVHKWAPGASVGVTVANGYEPGAGIYELSGTGSVFVDADNNVYVANGDYNRIQKWAPGASEGITVAGGLGSGSGANQLTNPSAVIVDVSGNIYVADAGNYRIQKLMPHLRVSMTASGITVAGGLGAVSAASQLSVPQDVFVDTNFNIYVADAGNYRIQKFAPGEINGITVAGGNDYGSAANQISPQGIFVDRIGNIYVADYDNHRIQKFAPGTTDGITVAGGNGFGSAANQISYPPDVFVDLAGNIYVPDQYNNRVQKWAPGASAGITVAGGNGGGSAANQLANPRSIFVDAAGNVYVSDPTNYRVQKWAPGASTGITVAGGNGPGNSFSQANPSGIFVDAAENIYVSEDLYNRILKWAPGASTGILVAGGSDKGSEANQLNSPQGIFMDADHNLYVADKFNQRIQKFESDYGLAYKYYEGTWTSLPDFNSLAPVKTGTSYNIDISKRSPDHNDNFAFVWKGKINIPTAGNYTFETISDDGSNLYFNTSYISTVTPTVNNNGLHSSKSATGTVNIAMPGTYPIAITFFENSGDEIMQVYWSGPGIPRQLIPDAAFTSGSGEDNTAPGNPSNLHVVSKGGNFITLDWDDAPDNVGVIAYDIYVGGEKRYSSSTSQVTADNLVANTPYNFKILARDLEGNTSGYSNSIVETTTNSINGLTYKYYEGDWDALPDFTTLTPVKTGNSLNVDIGVRITGRNDNFAFLWEGYINIPCPGEYTFETLSDDGSKIYFNTLYNPSAIATVNNDGVHGPYSATGSINVTSAGVYPISITFFEKDGGEQMQVYWTGPGIARQLIPDYAFTQILPPPPSGGLTYKYYEGTWDILPDFTTITPVKTGKSDNVDVSLRTPGRNDNFAFVWEGYINIPTAGNYTFETVSDDGSKLYFNTLYNPSATCTVNNDGLHAPSSVTGFVAVPCAGIYPISITFFEKDGGETMQVYWTGPGIARQLIPNSAFMQTPPLTTNAVEFKGANLSAISRDEAAKARVVISRVYPNPFDQSFNIDFYNSSTTNDIHVGIYDLNGKLLYLRHAAKIPKGNATLSVKPEAVILPRGIYMVQLKINGVPSKIVKLVK